MCPFRLQVSRDTILSFLYFIFAQSVSAMFWRKDSLQETGFVIGKLIFLGSPGETGQRLEWVFWYRFRPWNKVGLCEWLIKRAVISSSVRMVRWAVM